MALLALWACDSGAPSTPPPPAGRRVDSVPAPPKAPVDLDDFCELRPPAESAPVLSWPELDPDLGSAPAAGPGWTWVNVWATWCGPCIEEMPRILTWPEKLKADGVDMRLQLMSVDETASKVQGFRAGHHWMTDSLRSMDPNVVTPWLGAQGLDMPSVLPLHLFVDPQGRVRCARSGAVNKDAYEAIQALVKAG